MSDNEEAVREDQDPDSGAPVPHPDESEGGLADDVTAHPDYTGDPPEPSFDDPPS
jgi:hypothetical protein